MTFSENNSLLPGGSVSASEVKKLNEKIDNLSQTVTSVADSVSALSNEVNTSSLNVLNAVIDNATIGSETVSSADITDAEIESADITGADITNADITNAEIDEAEITSLTVTNEVAISVNSVSYTGQNIHVSDNIQTDKKLLGADVEATNAKFTNAEVTDLEVKGDTTVRGDVYFPENGDKIYGEYLEVEADKVKVKSLTTETPGATNNLVGYDANGNLIPVDASQDPSVLWQDKTGDITTIVPKNDKKVEATEITTPTLNADDVSVTNDLSVGNDVTVTGDITANEVIADVTASSVTSDDITVNDDLTVTNDAQIGNDLNVDGDTTLDDTTVDGTLQVNGDIIQNGSAYETHAEKVYTKNDLIFTRDGAVSALSQGDFTGIQAEKYDGTNDGQLVFDNIGEARVGDVGDTEPLMTRDELANMTDGYPVVWDGTGKKAKTGSFAQKDALDSGITSAKVNSIGDLTTLTTTDKTTLVDAINEVNAKDSATNATYASKIGTSASHPAIGSTSQPVYVDANGEVQPCTSITVSADANLDPTSNNAVQNSAVCNGLNMGGVCSTAKSTAAKTVTIPGFKLQTGSRVTVMFTYGNSEAIPTLNVSSTGAKPIKVVKAGAKVAPINHTGYWRGAASTSSEMWQPYTTLELLYDGTDWVIVGNPDVETYVDASRNGYVIKADGLIEQWGTHTNASTGSQTFDFFIQFLYTPTCVGNPFRSDNQNYNTNYRYFPRNYTTSQMEYYADTTSGNLRWYAKGY